MVDKAVTDMEQTPLLPASRIHVQPDPTGRCRVPQDLPQHRPQSTTAAYLLRLLRLDLSRQPSDMESNGFIYGAMNIDVTSSIFQSLFSTLDVTVHAWGPRVVNEFGATGARFFVIVHENGAAFIAVIGTDPSHMLLLNFGQFWLASTCSRWTSSTVTHRAPGAGIYLIFSTAASLDQFEECCDQVLPANILTSAAPSVQDLYDLGVIPAPRIVGDFLLGSSGIATSLSASDVGSDSDAASDTSSELSSPATLVDIESVFSLDSDEIDELASVMLEEDELASSMLEEDELSEGSAINLDYHWFELQM
ncbi:hypothetical protein LXA43DRAFT_1067976 [Ganoderma leucocontextum]|nr:hypothetical protein LXA43DRAFT_1067976 [Ganoderma leucocontextum]